MVRNAVRFVVQICSKLMSGVTTVLPSAYNVRGKTHALFALQNKS
jgi:hypothetical protein